VDKLAADSAKGINTLPVLLGRERSLFLNQQLFVTYFVFVLSLVLVGTLGVWTLLTFVAVPRAWEVIKVYNKPPPAEAPKGYPIWPLWYVAWAFTVTRSAGAWFVLGLVLDAIYPIHL
jgi:1,4-dihydroxy-2-naphthoate octaprenyltransferase